MFCRHFIAAFAVYQVTVENLERPDRTDNPVLRASEVRREPLDHRESPDSVAPTDPPESRENLDNEETTAKQDRQDRGAKSDHQVCPVRQDLRDNPETEESRARGVRLERPDLLENRVRLTIFSLCLAPVFKCLIENDSTLRHCGCRISWRHRKAWRHG